MAVGAKLIALSHWFLGSDPHMRIRVGMTSVSALISILYSTLALLLAYAGFAPIEFTWAWVAMTVWFNAAAYLAIRTGATRRFRDPALTSVQIRYAIVVNALGYVLLGEARGLMPVMLSLILMFGIFRLSAREMLVNVAFSVLCFGIAIGSAFWLKRPGHNMLLEFSYGVMVLLVLAGSTFVGVRIQHVRRRLQEQKLSLAEALERINHLAAHDELTGLVNRRQMTVQIQMERERCIRGGRPLVLALLDIDFFKSVNDQYGHASGDAVLCAFALCVQETLRSSDVVARWGGEEFLLLLAETELDGALILLERIRVQVENLRLACASGEIKVTVSAGLAVTRKGETLEQVLECADEALYAAKAQGRNRVVLSSHCDASSTPTALDAVADR